MEGLEGGTPLPLLRLLHEVSLAAMRAENATDALRVALLEVGTFMNWPIGHAYVRDEEGGLISTRQWHIDEQAISGYDALVQASEEIGFAQREGLPGRVLATRKPAWIVDIASDPNFPRTAQAGDAGLHSAFAFPVTFNERVEAVLEFFSLEPAQPDEAILAVMGTIGASLGSVFERLRSQDEVREREAHFRSLAENATDAIVTIDEDDRILFANTSMARLFGWPIEELTAMHFSQFMPERFRERHRNGLQRFVRTGVRHLRWDGIELPGLTRDGDEVPLEITFGTFERNGKRFFTGIMRDVSERRRVEEERLHIMERERQAREAADAARVEAERRALQESALRSAAAAVAASFTVEEAAHQIAKSALIATDADGAFVERIDAEAGEVVVLAGDGPLAPVPGVRTRYDGSLTREAIEREEPVYFQHLGLASGRIPPIHDERCGECSVAVIPLLDAGEPIGGLLLLRRPKRPDFHEDELKRAFTFGELAGLAFRKIHLLEDSERKRQELERVMESRARLVRGFSHDVKNPIGAADGYLALLEEGINGELTDESLASVTRARRSLSSALVLINDLLELARAEAGQIELRMGATDVREAAHEVVSEHQGQAERAGLALAFEAPDELPVIRSDAARVRQIIGNLLSNALKYTPAPGHVVVRVADEGDYVTVAVTDTGPGIPKEKQEFLFEEFSRLDDGVTGGAGIGLTISRRLAQALGGDIVLDSELGSGSTFTLRLPSMCVGESG